MAVNESWRAVLRGSGPMPLDLAWRWVVMAVLGAFLWVAVVVWHFPYNLGSSQTSLREFGRVSVALAMPYAVGYALFALGNGFGWIPAAWGRVRDGEAWLARPWGLLGARKLRIRVRSVVNLRRSCDRRVEAARVVWVECESRVLPLTCEGPIADRAVDALADWLRERGCIVSVSGEFDDPWAPTAWQARQGAERI